MGRMLPHGAASAGRALFKIHQPGAQAAHTRQTNLVADTGFAVGDPSASLLEPADIRPRPIDADEFILHPVTPEDG